MGSNVDDYTCEAMMYHQKFKVPPGKMTGWKRLVGQEIAIEGHTDLLSIENSASYPAPVANLLDINGDGARGAPVTAANTARKVVRIVSGPQTPKLTQPLLDLWVPLIFWFNSDPRLSIASVSIPYGQRFITVEIERQDNILFVAPGNLFLRLTVEQTYSPSGTNRGTADAQGVQDVKKWVTLTPVLATGSVIDSTQTIPLMELYINTAPRDGLDEVAAAA